MPTHLINQIRLSGVSFATSQLMSNGKILAFELYSGTCYIIEPDEYGSYRSPRVRRARDLPFTQLYGPISIANNGNVIVHCGEYGSSTLGYTQIFNPETETWTFYNATIANHSLALMSPNGTIWGAKRLPPNELPTAGQTISYTSNTGAMSLVPGYTSNTEACHAMLPNGNAAIFEFSYPDVNNSNNNPVYVGQLTLNETTGNIFWERTNVKSKILNLPPRFREYSPVSGLSGRWCSTGDGPKGVTYEPGVLTYMARTKKLVLVSGNGGIFTMDVSSDGSFNSDSLARPAALPNTPNWSPTNNDGFIVDNRISLTTYGGLVSGSSLAKTGQQIADAGTLQFTANSGENAESFRQMLLRPLLDSYTYGTPAVFVRLKGNTEWVKFIYTGVTSVTTGSPVITLTGVSLATWPGQVNWPTSTTDQVCLGRPSYDSRDGCATFLPNGDLLFAAGANTIGSESFNNACRLLKWNGTASIATNASDDSASIINSPEYYGSLFPLPDGRIWCGFGSSSVIYEPTQDEAIPFANSIPIITSAPTSFAAGSRFSLAGNGLTGVHEGGYFSEDRSPRTNFPIVKLRNTANNYVYYCMTRDFTYRGINPGEFSSCNVYVPYTVPTGSYQMSVVVNAVSSAEMTVTVGGQVGGEPMFLNRKA